MRVIRNLLLVGLVLAAATFVWAQPADLDFERGQLGKMPPGWFVPTGGYTATLTDQRPHKGKRCALLESGEPAAGVPFGNLMRAIDATPYRGKRVRLRAAVRCEPAGPGDRVQMWMRVDREGGKRGFFDNMGDRPIRSKSWRTYEIEGNIAADARSINVGFMLIRSGRLWMDDVTLEVVGEAAPVIHDPPRPLEGRALENLVDFERGQLGQTPPGWFVATAGYTATLTDQRPHKGKRCALLESGEPAAGVPFGNLMRAIDATPYRGKRVRLRAAVRCEPAGPGDRVQMWMRVDREGGKRGFFDNMGDRPIRSKSWRTYEIEGNIAADARSINVGFMLMRSGRLWMDDVTLEVVGEAAPVIHDPPRPLEGRALENLLAFTKLLGYLRYFHPSDEAADADWNALAVSGVRAVEPARDPRELARQLEELFRPIAPTVRVFPVGRTPPVPDALEPAPDANKLRVRAWRHRGVGTGEGPGRIYRSWRATVKAPGGKLPKSFADPSHPWVAELGAGVACMVPLALFADERGTLPHAADKQAETDSDSKPRRIYSGDDRVTRLADVALAWNVFQHFYPYFDVVDADWAKTLRSSLTSAAIDADERAFLQTLRRMVADLHDGHGRVMHASDPAQAHLPILWDWVEERLVITAVAKDAVADVKPGDIVRRIDGRKPEAVLADAEELISGATPQWRRFRALRAILAGEPGEQVALQIERGDADTRTVNLRRAAANAIPSEARPDKVAELDSGIFYVDLDRIESADFQEALPKLAKARGIVFDLRGYPRTMEMLAHLTEEPLTCAQWLVPKVREPDRRNMTFRFSNWPVQPKSPHFSARVAFVTDARAISFAETLLGIVEHYKLAEIVGGPTAGTNGNVNPFSLPGGYRVMWTGMKVLKHDGSRHHGVGILPTVPISRTIRGIREGRDELLDRAVAIVSK